MVKTASVLVLAAACALLASSPAMAKHKWSCYDWAWQSQDMKDCLAKQASAQAPAPKKKSTKGMKGKMQDMSMPMKKQS